MMHLGCKSLFESGRNVVFLARCKEYFVYSSFRCHALRVSEGPPGEPPGHYFLASQLRYIMNKSCYQQQFHTRVTQINHTSSLGVFPLNPYLKFGSYLFILAYRWSGERNDPLIEHGWEIS